MQQNLSAELGLPTGIAESYFKPESTPQRVVVMAVQGYGQDGKGIELVTKNDAGEVVETKKASLFADVSLNTEELNRAMKWQVLSRPAALQLGKAINEHGPSWPGELIVDIWTSGRGKEKQFHIARITPASIEAEKRAQEALAAAKGKPTLEA